MNIIATPNNVTIMDHGNGLRAIANADNMGDYWWIARMLIGKHAERGKGHGTRILQALIAEVVKQGGRILHVAPAGTTLPTKCRSLSTSRTASNRAQTQKSFLFSKLAQRIPERT